MSTQPDSTPQTTDEVPDKGVGCDALLAVCESVACKLNEAFNLYAWEDSKDHARQIVLDGIQPVIVAHQQRHAKAMDYAIALCRAIEYHCAGKQVPDGIAKDCPHHAAKLNALSSANKVNMPICKP